MTSSFSKCTSRYRYMLSLLYLLTLHQLEFALILSLYNNRRCDVPEPLYIEFAQIPRIEVNMKA